MSLLFGIIRHDDEWKEPKGLSQNIIEGIVIRFTFAMSRAEMGLLELVASFLFRSQKKSFSRPQASFRCQVYVSTNFKRILNTAC